MRRILSFCTLSLLISISWEAFGQTNITPAQRLRLARATYEAGRLHELVGTILGGPEARLCFNPPSGKVGFTDQEKVEAYKFLTLAHIYLENPAQADTNMLKILRTDHFYKPDNLTDPAEYLALYKTFRTYPLFAFGARIAANFNMTHLQENYYVWGGAVGNGKYKPNFSAGFGIFAEKEFFAKTKETNFLHWITSRFEVFYHNRNFNMFNPILDTYKTDIILTDANETVGLTSVQSDEGKVRTGWLDGNVILRYRFTRDKNSWDPYVGVGPGFSYLLSAKVPTAKLGRLKLSNTDETPNTVPSDSYSGPEINKGNQPTEVDVKDAFNPTLLSAIAVVGVNKRAGAFYINAEIRYQYGFGNRINPENRSIPQLLDYGLIANDFSFSNIQALAGITFPYFRPKKHIIKRK